MLIDLVRLDREYFERRPDLDDPDQTVRFGTNGHRGSSFRGSFNEAHVAAITQAICEYSRRPARPCGREASVRGRFAAMCQIQPSGSGDSGSVSGFKGCEGRSVGDERRLCAL